ncbi:Ribosomal protein S11 [Taphrina deformans PYCC 5710]|uniref:Ribosomal protein S11 n=1 Tax=Taphrina deformans (strain PYCC 5710 / ATCC 11124 / CBS 356.35 / IMI 108563 / JCM 9778 / NBRC 8474) TaxID=1097556 RepID=R4X9N3_TAPDE|nr:Ribosomal protein S11 [Taphrina deformans PYCC 5710]|eukprot:CCG82440.1 Ribosomal protein S11 [Taphrina deformans PYCC 5710]
MLSTVRSIHAVKRSSVRSFSITSVQLADESTNDAISKLVGDLDIGLNKRIQSSEQGGTTNPLPFAPRQLRSDTGNVYFRPQDAEKYQLATNKYYLHCLTSHSNTLLTLTNHKHEPIMWTSAGLCGFKKAARGGYEAGFRSTTMMLEKMKQKEEDDAALELKARTEPQKIQKTQAKKQKPQFKPASIELIIKDFGLGREAVMKALMGVEGDHYRTKITNIIDATPLKFGGVRARAVRRL